jgi:ATP-dependent Zn protease
MPYITQTSRNTIDAMAKGAFGQSVSELKETLKNNEKALHTTIVRLFKQKQMSAEDIAAFMELDLNLIKVVIEKHKLYKK